MDTKITDYYTSVRDNPKTKAVAAIEQAPPTARPAGNRERYRGKNPVMAGFVDVFVDETTNRAR